MAHRITPNVLRDAAFRQDGCHNDAPFEQSDLAPQDDEKPPELSLNEKNRNRIWRAMSWLLLADVLLFWLMTCVTAFAQSTATRTIALLM